MHLTRWAADLSWGARDQRQQLLPMVCICVCIKSCSGIEYTNFDVGVWASSWPLW